MGRDPAAPVVWNHFRGMHSEEGIMDVVPRWMWSEGLPLRCFRTELRRSRGM